MNKKIQSYNTTVLGLSPTKFLIPELPAILLYFFITILLFLTINIPAFWGLVNEPSGSVGWISEASNGSGLYKAWHIVSNSNLVAAIFWGTLGCLIYLLVWFLRSIVNNIRNDLIVASYVHPVTYKEYLYWRSLILRKLIFGLSFFILLVYLYSLSRLYLALAHFCFWRIEVHLNWANYLQLVGALIAGMFLLHVLTLILKISLNFWQFIYRDL